MAKSDKPLSLRFKILMRDLVSNKYYVALLIIVLLGLFLRVWRLDFGQELPYQAHTDEHTQYNPAITMLKTGDWNPHFFNYPSLTLYLDAIVLYAGFIVGKFLGVYESIADLGLIRRAQMAVGVMDTPELLLLGRATTATIGTMTIGLVYVLTKSLTRLKWTPLFVALLLAISMAHIRFSHYMTVDVIATFFAVACVTACTLALSSENRRWLWAAAVCGGLAASSKYNYAVLVLPVGLVSLLEPSFRWDRKTVTRIFVSGCLFCLAFAFTSPYVLLDFETAFEKGIMREIRHYATGHLGVTGSSFLWYLEYVWQVNAFYLLLGIPGLALAVWKRGRVAVPLVLSVVIYYLLIGRQAVHFDRNVLPVMVLLMVGVGIAVDSVVTAIPSGSQGRTLDLGAVQVPLVSLILALVSLLPSLWGLPALLHPSSPSGKAQAQMWFDQALETPYGQQHLTQGQSPTLNILAEAYTVYLDPKRCQVDYRPTITEIEHGLAGIKSQGYDIVILGSGMFFRFYQNPDVYADQVDVYDAFFERVPDSMAFEGKYDPLEFREGGGQVYVFFLTDQAREFKREMEMIQRE